MKKSVLLLAQVPPPLHGQSIMQKYLKDAEWNWCEKSHIPLNYSDNINEVGNFSLKKITKLFSLLVKIWQFRKSKSIDLLYYPPAGPNRIPLYRDIITLLFAKLMAKKIILHFHAGGLSQLIPRLNPLEVFFAKRAFKNIDSAIVLLPWLKHETEWFSPKKVHVIPNGIVDAAFNYQKVKKETNNEIQILFVGNLKEEKGIFDLLLAVSKLKNCNRKFKVKIMGEAHTQKIDMDIKDKIMEYGISEHVELLGTRSGDKKWKVFSEADVFCLPTFATEAMPVSIIEAMMFSLPTVTTNWRGIPNMITEGEEGFLVPVNNAEAIAQKLNLLINDDEMILNMGNKARKTYENHYSIEKHLSKMEVVFKQIVL